MGKLRKLLLQEAAKISNQWNDQQVATISPSPYDIINQVTAGLALSPSDMVIDMGCGDGRWLTHITSCYTCQCWGVEIDSERLSLTLRRIEEENLQQYIELVQCDLYAMNLSKFTVVIVYLSREGNEKLKSKILRECDQQTTIIAVGFSFRGWKPHHIYQTDSGRLSAFHYLLSEQLIKE